jgi:hypothetical protein
MEEGRGASFLGCNSEILFFILVFLILFFGGFDFR